MDENGNKPHFTYKDGEWNVSVIVGRTLFGANGDTPQEAWQYLQDSFSKYTNGEYSCE